MIPMAGTMSTSNSLHPYPHTSQRSPTTSSTSDHTTTPTSPHFATAQIQHAHIRTISRSTNHTNTPPLHHAASSSQVFSITPERSGTPPIFNPPNGSPFSTYLRGWSDADIASWLSTFGCGHLGDLFRHHDIDGKVLLDLDMASLKEMGIQKVGERVKVLSGIKDLRKRVSASPSISRVELRLNGAATPPLSDGGRGGLERSGSRRLHSTRPPPLDLHSHSSSRNLPSAYQSNGLGSAHTDRGITPRAGTYASRPGLGAQGSSNTTITSSTVPAPAQARPGNLNLRAPPARDAGQRSPSPIIADAASFADRPLPPAPGYSAGEYASGYGGSSRGATTPTPGWTSGNQAYGLPKGPSPGSDPRRPTLDRNGSLRGGVSPSPDHRKAPSLTKLPPNLRQGSPSRSQFQQNYTSSGPSRISPHPFAARSTNDVSPPSQQRPSPPHDPYISSLGHSRSGSGYGLPPKAVRKDTSGSGSSAPLSLEDLRKQLVKFVNAEDGTMKTVNVSSCISGVEVLERVLKKFNKWNPSNVNTESESDEDGERLEVDGWGVYIDNDPESRPLSESALLQVCLSHRDGSRYIQDRGLVLKCTRKQGNRKNMDAYLGEGAPPMSPASPTTYFGGGPRLGINPASPDLSLLAPSRSMGSISSVATKRTNRASIVSVMSGLGVPMADAPPSPGSARSPGSSFLPSRKKMYNFFGHRPPSELISSHLAEYFPSAKKKELEKTVRHSMRLSMGRRSSAAPSIIDSYRLSGESARPSPPRRRPTSRSTLALSPPAGSEAIPEEAEYLDHDEPLPRMSVSNDNGELRRPVIDGESEDESVASEESRGPPLLPPFEPSKESFSDSLGAYSASPTPSTRIRPKSLALSTRRGSGGSSRSRMSMLSQFRKPRDRADNASLLTVDEITAEVEQRRASTITFEDSDEEEDAAEYLGRPAVLDQILPQSEDEDDDERDHDEASSGAGEEGSDEDDSSEGSEEEEEDEEEEEESDEGEDQDHGKAFTSTGSKRIIKWIKGALIGAGSFGSVFLGMDAHSGLLMAVKQVDLPTGGRSEEKKKSMVDALEREIELLKELQHENIVQYLDSSADGAHLNIFLEYVPGGSVAALLNNYGAFEEALVRNFVRQILTGLNYLHEREIIHRDIKGANILVDNKGGIKISDFGISKKVENNLMHGMRTNRPSLQGSVFWMAPEIVKQTSYTSKADIWSVGCLVVEMLTGTHPWADLTQMQAIFRIGSSARPSNPSDISPEAADFLNRSFEIDHTARPTAAELIDHQFISDSPSSGANGGGAARNSTISVAQAKASMTAAHANAQRGMAMMGAARA